jgi:cation transport ATPase
VQNAIMTTPNSDLLTRTTLQIDTGVSTTAIARVVAALQRVPGVLLAEVNAATARATVAHDAAVPAASLLAAITASGAHAKIVAEPPSSTGPSGRGLQLGTVRVRRLTFVSAAVFVPLAIVDILLPNTVDKTWLLPIFIAALWAFFFAESFVARRP